MMRDKAPSHKSASRLAIWQRRCGKFVCATLQPLPSLPPPERSIQVLTFFPGTNGLDVSRWSTRSLLQRHHPATAPRDASSPSTALRRPKVEEFPNLGNKAWSLRLTSNLAEHRSKQFNNQIAFSTLPWSFFSCRAPALFSKRLISMGLGLWANSCD
ncbi:hypothetical protein BDV12DRAFT_24875 [Aspergillus spectabilis]